MRREDSQQAADDKLARLPSTEMDEFGINLQRWFFDVFAIAARSATWRARSHRGGE
jgi:hypothetical protein